MSQQQQNSILGFNRFSMKQNELYSKVACDILNYVNYQMVSEEGGFYRYGFYCSVGTSGTKGATFVDEIVHRWPTLVAVQMTFTIIIIFCFILIYLSFHSFQHSFIILYCNSKSLFPFFL